MGAAMANRPAGYQLLSAAMASPVAMRRGRSPCDGIEAAADAPLAHSGNPRSCLWFRALAEQWISFNDGIQFRQHVRDIGLVKSELELETILVSRIPRD